MFFLVSYCEEDVKSIRLGEISWSWFCQITIAIFGLWLAEGKQISFGYMCFNKQLKIRNQAGIFLCENDGMFTRNKIGETQSENLNVA